MFSQICNIFSSKKKKKDTVATKKTFTKYDLQTGMVVENREGTKFLVLREPRLMNAYCSSAQEIIFTGEGHWDCGENYNENLLCAGKDSLGNSYERKNLDIVKVYRHGGLSSLNHIFKNDGGLELIWSREEEKIEMTLKQVADKLGIDVTKLRIKD